MNTSLRERAMRSLEAIMYMYGMEYGVKYQTPSGKIIAIEDNGEVYEILDDGSYFLRDDLLTEVLSSAHEFKQVNPREFGQKVEPSSSVAKEIEQILSRDEMFLNIFKHIENNPQKHPHRQKEFTLKCSQCSSRVKVVGVESPTTLHNNQHCPSCGAFLLD